MDEVLDLIGPAWTFVRRDWRPAEIKRLVEVGWVAVRERPKYRLVRLTALGLRERDRLDAMCAADLSRRLYG